MNHLPDFSDLPAEDLKALLEKAAIRAYSKGTIIVNEGDLADSLYLIISGHVRVFLSNEHGREIAIGQLGPGDYFGEMSLEPGSRSASVITTEPARFGVVRCTDFRQFLAAHPDFMLALIGKLIRRARTLARSVRNLALLDVYARLTQLLSELATARGDIWVIEESLTQKQIAERIGSSREMVSRIFKDLVAGGYLVVDRKRIEIRRRLPSSW